MQTINDRIEVIIAERFGGNKSAFAKAIGYKPQMMSTYLGTSRRSRPSVEMVAAILRAVDVDARWLVLGDESVPDDTAVHIATVSGHHNTTAVDATIHTGDVERLATLEQLVDTQQRYIRLLEQQLAGAAVRAPNAPQ